MARESYFVCRLKANCDPLIESILSEHSLDITGEKLSELIPHIPGNYLDLQVKLNNIDSPLRVLGLRHNDKWYLYLTNIFDPKITAEITYQIYRQRWVIELLFNDLKNRIDLTKIATRNDNAVRIEIYAGLIRFMITRIIMTFAAQENKKEQKTTFTPKITAEQQKDPSEKQNQKINDGYSMRKCINIVNSYAYELFETTLLKKFRQLRHYLKIIIHLMNQAGFIERRQKKKALSGIT